MDGTGEKRGRGRPKSATPLLHKVHLRFDDRTFERIRGFAESRGWNQARTIRHLVLIGLREEAGVQAVMPKPMERTND